MAYQSINVYAFSREVYFKYLSQMLSNKEQSASPCWRVHYFLFGAEGFFVRRTLNHKHLKEPAAHRSATTFVTTLPAKPSRRPSSAVCAVPATVHASERLTDPCLHHNPFRVYYWPPGPLTQTCVHWVSYVYGDRWHVFLGGPGSRELTKRDSEIGWVLLSIINSVDREENVPKRKCLKINKN